MEAGKVISQSAEAGSKTTKNTEIQIVVSKGAAPAATPSTAAPRDTGTTSTKKKNTSDGYTSIDDMEVSNGD